ncbi:MAG: hypothetical protein A2W25_01325 [candidate division Zixibacteria bacterium RBG_16_53_22]|nr:MAG: hypothetical protein A2W25_01325 [candidate division Zixibacteria bacterium RBG_16_53_22]
MSQPQNERVHGTRHETREEAIADAFDYIEPFYNRKQKHSTRGYALPMEFQEDWIRSQHKYESA